MIIFLLFGSLHHCSFIYFFSIINYCKSCSSNSSASMPIDLSKIYIYTFMHSVLILCTLLNLPSYNPYISLPNNVGSNREYGHFYSFIKFMCLFFPQISVALLQSVRLRISSWILEVFSDLYPSFPLKTFTFLCFCFRFFPWLICVRVCPEPSLWAAPSLAPLYGLFSLAVSLNNFKHFKFVIIFVHYILHCFIFFSTISCKF